MANVPAPLFISSRLMAALKIGDVGLVEIGAHDRDYEENRVIYQYFISDASGEVLDTGTDLRSGAGADVNYLDMMRVLLGFLTAACESYPDGENADLFSPECVEWALEHYDHLEMAELELEHYSGEE